MIEPAMMEEAVPDVADVVDSVALDVGGFVGADIEIPTAANLLFERKVFQRFNAA